MIKEFKNEYSWLSNFHLCKIMFDGMVYNSVEHAYVSAKNDDYFWKKQCQDIVKPYEVKKFGQNAKLIPDWDKKKLGIMRRCIEQKFNQEPLKTLLLSTGDEEIQEGNNWHDTYWGVDLKTGKGENHLGKLIMEKRDKLRGIWV